MSYARALYAFQGTEATDLSFEQDAIIQVIAQDPTGWWEGQLDNGERGEFPYNFVEVIPASDVPGLRDAGQGISKPNRVSMAADRLTKVKVSVQSGSSPTRYSIEAILPRKKVTGQKSLAEFRSLDEAIHYLFPGFDRPLPPSWADNLSEPGDSARKKAKVLQIYLQKLVGNQNDLTECLLMTWLNPRESFRTSTDAIRDVNEAMNHAKGVKRHPAAGNAFPLALVEFDWNASDAVELGLHRDCIVAIRNQKTTSEGWWEGETSDGQRGLFPANYVKLLSSAEAQNVVSGQFNVARAPQESAFLSPRMNNFPGVANNLGASQAAKKASASNRSRKTENNFALPSLDAFDELLIEGFTMLRNNKVFTPTGAENSPGEGAAVSLAYTAYVWDCQKQRIIEFAASDLPDPKNHVGPLEFKVGGGQTIKALERAVQSLEIGQESRIIVRPDLGYGEVGNPPSVPPNCHLVYDVKLEKFDQGNLQGAPSASVTPAYNLGAPIGARMKRKPHNHSKAPPVHRGPPGARSNGGPPGQRIANNAKKRADGPKFGLQQMQRIVESKQYEKHGVDPAFLEDMLTPEGFQAAFKTDRAQFLLMPRWKQNKLKQDAGLY